jgi:hypothetical protein
LAQENSTNRPIFRGFRNRRGTLDLEFFCAPGAEAQLMARKFMNGEDPFRHFSDASSEPPPAPLSAAAIRLLR